MTTLIPSSEDAKVYEFCVLMQSDLGDKAESQLVKSLETLFAEVGAKILFKDAWSKRGLAYSIRGHVEGKFTIYYVELDPMKVRDLDGAIRLEKGVMRHMIVIPPKGYEAVSYEEKYLEWEKTHETQSEIRERVRREKLEERVKAKAKVEAKRMEAKKKEKVAPAMTTERLDEEIGKLISDEDLTM
jgi:small subunit ribosomal protein S6